MKAAITVRRASGFAWLMPYSRRQLKKILNAMRHTGDLDSMPMELVLADDAVLSEANAAYLACTGPTNILSFPPFFGPCLGSDLPGQGLLAISTDAIQRECLLYGQDPKEHVLRVLAHGMAHLAGLDHGEAMSELEAIFLRAGKEAMHTQLC